MNWLLTILSCVVAFYVCLILIVNRIPHVTIKSFGWLAFKHVTVTLPTSRIYIRKIYFRFHLFRWRNSPVRFLGIEFVDVNIERIAPSNEKKSSQPRTLNIPEELQLIVPKRLHNFLISTRIINQVIFMFFRVSVCDADRRDAYSLFVDVFKMEASYSSVAKNRVSFAVYNLYLSSGDPKSEDYQSNILQLRNIEFTVLCSVITECPIHDPSKYAWSFRNFDFNLSVDKLVVPLDRTKSFVSKLKPSTTAKVPETVKINKRKQIDANLDLIDQILKLVELTDIKFNDLVLSCGDVELTCGNAAFSITPLKKFNTIPTGARVFTIYLTSTKLHHKGTKCLDLPSGTFALESTPMRLIRRIYNFMDHKCEDFGKQEPLNVASSVTLTNSVIDIYHDQLDLIQHLIKPKSSSKQKPAFAPIIKHILAIVSEVKLKIVVVTTTLNMHFPKPSMSKIEKKETFHRDAYSNMVVSISLQGFVHKFMNKNLSQIIQSPSSKHKTQLLTGIFKFVGFEYLVADNTISLPKFSMKATYDVFNNNISLTVILKNLKMSSVNSAIFHLAREIRNRNIEHSNRRYDLLMGQDKDEPPLEDPQKEVQSYVKLFEILPSFISSIKVSVTSLQADIICNDGLPSFTIYDETLKRDIDLAEFKRGVSIKIEGVSINYKRASEDVSAKMRTFQCFTLSEYMSEYIPDFDLVTTYDEQSSTVSDVTSLDTTLSEENDSANLKRVKKVVYVRDLKIGNYNKEDKNLLTLMIPEADGRLDTFFIWCSIYARTLIHYFAPTVKRKASGRRISQLSGSRSNLKLNVKIDSVAVVSRFPNNVDALFEIESLTSSDVITTKEANITFARVYVVHPAVKRWARLLSIAHFNFKLGLDLESNLVDVFATTIRLNIPYSFLFYTVFDNIITFAKAVRQIKQNFLNFVEGNNDYSRILPQKRDATDFPSVRIRTKTLGMSLENDPFERELGFIFELAAIENENRLRKIDLFEKKVDEIRAQTKPSIESQIELTYDQPHKHTQKHEPSFRSPLRNVIDDSKTSSRTRKTRKFKTTATPTSNGASTAANQEELYTEEEAARIIASAKESLDQNLSSAWIKKYKLFKHVKLKSWRERVTRLWGKDEVSETITSKYDILEYSDPPYLMGAGFKDFDLELSKARIDDIHEFLHKHGQGQPRLDYSILVPLYGRLRSSALFVYIRDYPLPLVSFPSNSDPSKTTIDLRGNLVVNEKLVTRKEEMRYIFVPFSPSLNEEKCTDTFYSVYIPRTLTPVKFTFDFECDLTTDRACMLSWCKSYQPGISAVATAFDSFTKPAIDDSPLGWWDKVALLLHGKIKFNIPNELCLHMKGSASPYELIGKAAGLVFCWKNNVSLRINDTGEPKELILLDSDDFILGIPNYSSTERKTWSLFYDETHPNIEENDIDSEAKKFHKRVMKLTSSDRVQWKLGFDFERNVNNTTALGDDQERTRDFKPHYDVVVTNPMYEWHPDSYEKYRSDYLHLAFSVISKSSNGNAFNATYLTPLTFFYFFHWWHMMTKYTSLPIKQGPLFVNSPVSKSHVKMGLHLYTVKYQLIFEPLVISHLYMHSTTSVFDHKDKVAFTGLKGKCTSCTIDLHQRKETLQYINKKLNIDNKTMHLKMNEAEVEIQEADIRFINAQFKDKAISAYLATYLDDSSLSSPTESKSTEGGQSFTSWYADFESSHDSSGPSWYDPDDLVELELHDTLSPYPKIRILPFLYTPKFSYIREFSLQKNGPYPFGREDFHDCVLGRSDPEQTQMHLIDSRIDCLGESLQNSNEDSKEYRIIKERIELLDAIKDGLSGDDISRRSSVVSESLSLERVKTTNSSYKSYNDMKRVTSLNSAVSEFHNRFIFHNVQMKWDNTLRDLFMEYSEKISDRRSQMFFMGKKAVDLIREVQAKFQRETSPVAEEDDHIDFQCGEDFINCIYDTIGEIDEEKEESDNKYLIKFIHPQIQLTSSKNKDSCMIITSRDLEVRIVAINMAGMNNVISEDEETSSNIETRYGVVFKDSHAFVFKKDKESISIGEAPYGTMHSCSKANWPPWVDFEVCYDSSWMTEYLVFERASMGLKSIQPNTLQNSDNKSLKNSLFVSLSKLVVNATSEQYSTIYFIASNLLIRGKTHQDELISKWNKLASLSDATDFEGLDEKVKSLQDSIRASSHILLKLDSKGIPFDEEERESIRTFQLEVERRKLELIVLMRSIGLKSSKTQSSKQFARFTRIAADQVIWHLLDDDREPFVDFALANAWFTRSDYADGSNYNNVDVSIVQGFNLRTGAVYPDLLMPLKEDKTETKDSLLSLTWKMLDPVGGIVMIKDARLTLKPLKVQLDHNMAHDLFKYLFPDSKNTDDSELENEVLAASQVPPDEDMAPDSEKTSKSRNPLRKLIKKRITSSSTPVNEDSDADHSSISSTSSKTRVDTESDQSVQSRRSIRRSESLSKKTNSEEFDYADAVVTRSSKYYSIINFDVSKTIVSISYKAPKHLNIIDVHNLALTIPSLSYRDKIWSAEDFVLRLRKDVIKMILSNSGKIISNKFKLKKRHANQEPLKQISDYASYMTIQDLQSDGRARDATKTNSELKPHHRHHHHHRSGDGNHLAVPHGEEVYRTYFASDDSEPPGDSETADDSVSVIKESE
ncbi:hypothetical protein QA089_005179 [Meyerozyma guilliermondii]